MYYHEYDAGTYQKCIIFNAKFKKTVLSMTIKTLTSCYNPNVQFPQIFFCIKMIPWRVEFKTIVTIFRSHDKKNIHNVTTSYFTFHIKYYHWSKFRISLWSNLLDSNTRKNYKMLYHDHTIKHVLDNQSFKFRTSPSFQLNKTDALIVFNDVIW